MLCSSHFILLVLLLGQAAAPKEDRTAVKVEAVGNQVIKGTMAVSAISIDCDLGRYAIKVPKIKEIRFTPGDQNFVVDQSGIRVPDAVIVTTSGEEIRGTLLLPQADVETDLGNLSLKPNRLRKMTFEEKK